MKAHIRTGKTGEYLALVWLLQNGYSIETINWRTGRLELDIIASKNNRLHIIEVKTSSGTRFGWPEERLTLKKIQRLQQATAQYIARRHWKNGFQIDLLSITHLRTHWDYHLIENISF
jgi:putative endonuclease